MMFLQKNQSFSTGDYFPTKHILVSHFEFKYRRGKCLVLPLASHAPVGNKIRFFYIQRLSLNAAFPDVNSENELRQQ